MKALRAVIPLIIISTLFALVLVTLFGRSTYDIGGATVEITVAPAWNGKTELNLPPLGTISAKTHKLPVKVSAKMERVSLESLKNLADGTTTKSEIFARSEKQAQEALRMFLVKILVLSAVGGMIAGMTLSPRSWQKVVAGGLIALTSVSVLAAATVATYDYRAFRQPRYTGLLSAAPWLMNSIEEKLNDFNSFRKKVKKIASNLHYFYSKMENMEADHIGDDTLRVLHVSDIHNNPAGLDLINQVSRDFRADLIIDTGDISDFGTPIEAGLVSKVKDIGIPYLFIPGNHDSPELVAELDALEKVTVLRKGEVYGFEGLSVLGFPDPTSAAAESQVSQTDKVADKYAEELRDIFIRQQQRPDIVAVHDIRNADRLKGRAALVLSGHTHRAGIETIKGTHVINAGTTGAAGLRTFEVEEGLPYTLQLLYIKKDTGELILADSITIKGIQQEFTLERKVIDSQKTENREKSLTY